MSLVSRIVNVFRGDRINREIDEELQSHLEEAIAQGRDPEEARRALGIPLKLREDSRDIRIAPWLDSLRADFTFGLRQLIRNKVAAGAAIVSLAMAIGACTSAFRLIDALLLRPLPVAAPDRLHVLAYDATGRDGKSAQGASFDYPCFRALRSAVKGEAELLAISYPRRNGITYGSDDDTERVNVQFVSGWMFGTFGMKPALGRLLTESDDLKPSAHPLAVLAYDHWNSRFGRDPNVLGRSFRMGNDVYRIIGVAPEGFTGTEPGTLTDIFIPTMMMGKAIDSPHWSWFRTWVQLPPGSDPGSVRDKLQATFRHNRAERSKDFGSHTEPKLLTQYINAPITLEPAAAGFSFLQMDYRRALYILGAMVGLVLLVACVNVANLMMAQAASRAREMALRVSIGAGRARLVQLMLAESALIAIFATVFGGLFAWWAAPFVVNMISAPDNPTRLILPADWRVTGFAVALTIAVTFLFGSIPALRASAVKPAAALKGGEEPGKRHRLMTSLVAAQVAFCFVVHFVAGLFVATFDRLSNQPLGFSADNVLTVEFASKREQPIELWNQVTEHVKSMKGVESAALCLWPLMGHSQWSTPVWIDGRQMHSDNPFFLSVSSEWLNTMRIPLLGGRNFRRDEKSSSAIVSESFARKYFNGGNPVGRTFARWTEKHGLATATIIGYVPEIRYSNMRDPVLPVVFYPVNSEPNSGTHYPRDWGTLVIRTTGDPLALTAAVRQEITRARPEFRVITTRTQRDLVDSHTVRERLLAMLSLFFATVALVLAGVGLYGVLNYSVLQQRREIGIRVALGARPADLARRLAAHTFGMLAVGSVAGLALGFASEQYIETLLYQVTARDLTVVVVPLATILLVAVLAALPPLIRAVRIDPAAALRTD